MTAGERAELMAVARGEMDADLLLTGGTLLNVYAGQAHRADVAVYAGRIALVGDASKIRAREVRDVSGLYLAPGLVEPHSHVSVFYNPRSYAQALLPRGITTVVCDDLPLRSSYGPKELGRAFAACSELPLRYYWLLRVGSYGPHEPDNPRPGEKIAPLAEIREELQMPRVLGIAEVTRWINIIAGQKDILEAFDLARANGKIVQGHTSGARAGQLNLLVLSGVDSCHEAITAEQALDRLRLGMYTMLRHSSLRPDLPELMPLLTEMGLDLSRIMLSTDGSSPAHLVRCGNLDGMYEMLTQAGLPPVRALQLATRNPAGYLGLEAELGAIAPGRVADICLLEDPMQFRPLTVYVGGRVIAERGELVAPLPEIDWAGVGASPAYDIPQDLSPSDLLPAYAGERVPLISFVNSVITRRREVQLPRLGSSYDISGQPELLYAALVARDGRFVSSGIVEGLMRDLGGFATSYLINGQLLAVGRDPESMLLALRQVAQTGGGFAHVFQGRTEWLLPLSLLGTMRAGSFADAVEASRELERFCRAHGYRFEDPAYSFLFLVGDFLPGLRLTARGLVDAKSGDVLWPAVHYGEDSSEAEGT